MLPNQDVVEAPLEVGVEDHIYSVLSQSFPADPHYLLGPAWSIHFLPRHLIQLTTRWVSVGNSAPIFT